MKTSKTLIPLLCFLVGTSARAQDVHTVVQRYRAAIADIEILHARVTQLDTFVTGTVWQHTGELTLLRDPADTLFGFQYRAAKEVYGESLYDGRSAFRIDHDERTYEVETQPGSYILGSPGGQLVVPELLYDQDPDITPELTETDQYYLLRYAYPDLEEYDVRQREKKIFLDKTTFLPVKVIERQEALDKKQVLTRLISDVKINRAAEREGFRKDFLSSYTMVVEDPEEDVHAELRNTPVQDFQLPTFAGQSVSTHPEAGTVLLLDFWEVWCGPCVQSLPKVQALADRYGARGLAVVGVLMDPTSQDSAEKMIEKRGVAFTHALGSPELRAYFRVYAIPQYVLIDRKGIIRDVFLGYDEDIEDRIKALLAEAE